MAALDQIVGNMPVANERRRQQQQAATDLQLQQAVKAVPAAQATPAIAQTLGAGAAQAAGQQAVDTAKQNVAVNQQAGGMALQQKQADIQQGLQALRRGQDTAQLTDEQQFANISEAAKREMFDSRMQFSKDEQGRSYMNERQLADYALTHARNVDQLRDYTQTAEQLQARKSQALEAAQARIDQELQFQSSLSNQQQDQALKQRLVEAKRALEQKIARDRANAANRAGTFGVVTGLAGAAAGAAMTGGSPAGAMIGYQAGSAIGTGVAARTQ